MDKCRKCGESEMLKSKIEGSAYCKRCHPVTLELIGLIETKAVNRSRLPKDLNEYFARDYVHPALLSSEAELCSKCKSSAPCYTWYDNNYLSKMYWYCTNCNRISSKVD